MSLIFPTTVWLTSVLSGAAAIAVDSFFVRGCDYKFGCVGGILMGAFAIGVLFGGFTFVAAAIARHVLFPQDTTRRNEAIAGVATGFILGAGYPLLDLLPWNYLLLFGMWSLAVGVVSSTVLSIAARGWR